ncbi:MAG TPA: hypothetical protein VFM94_11245 [Solirubrobacterales bacterium]|nr:hypothetical protein [Solirubrobacterales bacterium]
MLLNSLSVDFTVPESDAGAFIPISVLPKWPPLYRFDFRHSDGTSLPLLTSEQNGIVDEALLLALVEKVSPSSLNAADFHDALSTLARGPETHLENAFERFHAGLEGDLSDPRVERVLDIAAMLTDATVLWYPIRAHDLGVRTVCKVEYLIRNFDTERRHIRLLRSLAWLHPAAYIPLWHIGADANFHAEVEAPPVLTIRSLEPRYYLFSEESAIVKPGDSDSEPDPDSKAAEAVGLRPDQYIDEEGGLAHLYVSGRRPLGVDLIATFAPSRATVLPMFGAAVVIAALATAFYFWRDQMSVPANVDAAIAVLILIPALIGYVVIRPSDPPIVRRYVLGVQLLSLAASAIPLLMAVLLLRYGGDPDCLRLAWLWPMYASWLISLALGVSFLRAGSRAQPD